MYTNLFIIFTYIKIIFKESSLKRFDPQDERKKLII